MCQNSGSLRPSGSNLFSMMLQPSSPRRSGEFSTQVGISCAVAIFAVSAESAITAIAEHAVCVVITILHVAFCNGK